MTNLFLPPLLFSHILCLLIPSQLLDFPHRLAVTGPAFHLKILPQDCNYLFSFTLCFSLFVFSLALEFSRFPSSRSVHYFLSLSFTSLPSLEALNHSPASSLLHLLPFLFPPLSSSLRLQLCRQGLRAGISSDVPQEYALAHCLDCSSPTAPLSATKSSTQRGRTEKKCFTATFLYAIFSSQHLRKI